MKKVINSIENTEEQIRDNKEEAKQVDPVEARINKALEKLISKIREKHFSPEIQKALKEMGGPLGSKISIKNSNPYGYDTTLATVELDDVYLFWIYSIYSYKDSEMIRDQLIGTVRISEFEFDSGHVGTIKKFLIEYIYDYFFDGRLEKDIEKLGKTNRDYEAQKEKEKLKAADRLCELTKE